MIEDQLSRVRTTLLSTLLLASASGAVAAVPLTSTFTATPGTSTGATLSATAFGNNGTASVSGGPGVALVPLSRFNPSTGILLGARLTATVPVSVAAVVTGVVPNSGSGRSVTATATYTGAITGPGVSIAGSPIVATKSCSGGNCLNSPSNQEATSTGTVSGNAAVGSASLSSYYGAGTVNIATAGTLQSAVANGANVTSGTASATVSRTAGSSYALTYDYLNFSQPSFSGASVQTSLTLDFGSLKRSSGPVTLNFSLYNIGNANSAGFDVLSVSSDMNNPLFTSTLAPFTNSIAGGASRSFSATFDPASLGSQVDRLRLTLKDSSADVGDGLGARETVLDLYFAGFVFLPEPGTWATLIVGFGLVGATMRRRRALAVG